MITLLILLVRIILNQHPKEVVPMGHEAVYNTVFGDTKIPAVVFKTK